MPKHKNIAEKETQTTNLFESDADQAQAARLLKCENIYNALLDFVCRLNLKSNQIIQAANQDTNLLGWLWSGCRKQTTDSDVMQVLHKYVRAWKMHSAPNLVGFNQEEFKILCRHSHLIAPILEPYKDDPAFPDIKAIFFQNNTGLRL